MRRKNSRSHGTVIWRQLDRKTLQRLQLTFSLFSQNIYGSKHSIETRYISFKSQQNQILQKSLSLTHLIQECVVSIWPSIREEGGYWYAPGIRVSSSSLSWPSSSPSSSSPASFSVPHTLLPSIFNFPFLGSQVEASDIDMNLHLYLPLHNCTCTCPCTISLCTTSDIYNNQILPLLLITLNSFLLFIKGMIVQCTKYIHLNGKQVFQWKFHEPIFRTRARGAILFVSDF